MVINKLLSSHITLEVDQLQLLYRGKDWELKNIQH